MSNIEDDEATLARDNGAQQLIDGKHGGREYGGAEAPPR